MTTPATPRDAATVVVLRDGADGLEVYLVKRARTVDFMAGAHVFPGGRLDPADSEQAALGRLSVAPGELARRLGERIPPARAAGLFVAAVRETLEEAGLQLDAASLMPWVRWVTPEISPRRFDARFFLARAPEGQEARPDGHEAVEGLWITPARALERWSAGEIQLVPATAKSIDMLMRYRSVADALGEAARRLPPVLMPVVWNDRESGHAYISLPGDPRHPMPDFLGGDILRLQVSEGRYHPVKP